MNFNIDMALIDQLRIAIRNNISSYITFLQKYSKMNSDIHVFHEGKDDPSFYGNYLEKYITKQKRVIYYKSSNKDQVYDNYNKIDWINHDKKRIIFLVDKDFSDFMNIIYTSDINIFVTSYYSIENYIVKVRVLKRTLIDLMGLNEDLINIIVDKYKDSVKSFHDSTLYLIAYCLYHKRMNNRPVIANIKFSMFYNISEDLIFSKKHNCLQQLDSACKVLTRNASYDILNIVRELQAVGNPKKYIRGKFELSFFVKFINSIPKLLNEDVKQGNERFKLAVNLSDGNALQILSPRTKKYKEIKLFFKSLLEAA